MLMSTNVAILVAGVVVYKLAALAVGTLFCSMGYQLFKAGIWGNAGDFKASFKGANVVLKSFAPGSFFALLGAAIISFTLYKGLDMIWKNDCMETNIGNAMEERKDEKPHLP